MPKDNPGFPGFPEGKVRLTPIPEMFFEALLPQINHLGELKLMLHAIWRLSQMEGDFHYLRRADLAADGLLTEGLQAAGSELGEALDRAVARGALLEARFELESGEEPLYFLNSPKGRAAVQAIQDGRWRATGKPESPIQVGREPPNIFRLYEENIGPLTPMIAEALKEAEDTYPIDWIEDAIRIAVERNKRTWRYAVAILERWQREGRDARRQKPEDRRDAEEDRRRYIQGEFSDFIEH
jgi:DnaD/phage-associated family protein